jgi:hypothetical protein
LPTGRGYLVDGRGKFYGDDTHEFYGDDTHEFYGDDTHEGKPIKAHFIWSGIALTSARWEQEFSDDGGATGESNWVVEFVRV